jgi:hypothetical protein
MVVMIGVVFEEERERVALSFSKNLKIYDEFINDFYFIVLVFFK